MFSFRGKALLIIPMLFILTSLACQLPDAGITPPTGIPTSLTETPFFSPTIQTTSISTDNPSAVPPPTTLPTLAVVSPHRIGIHSIFGLAEFYDRTTEASFTPRGVNYFLLVPVADHYEDRLFAQGIYDRNRIQADFKDLATAGYNTVRISLDGCSSGDVCIGLKDGQGLNPTYLDNIVDLLRMAKAANLFVLFTSQGLPELGGYAGKADQEANAFIAPGRNAQLLTPAGIYASQQYWTDVLTGLAERQAPFDVVLGWELLDEQYFQADQLPFSLDTGFVTLSDGKEYDMARQSQREALAIDGLRRYIDQLRQTILTYDPTALVSMGFLAPDIPNAWRTGDNRFVITAPLLENSSLDFFDLHTSPGTGITVQEYAQNFGLGGHISKPVIMGEVGASTWSYPQVDKAAIAIQDWIAASCAQGFKGWIYSTYYPFPAGLSDASWGFLDQQGLLLNALAPRNQPEACAITVLPGRNLALGKPVQVSAALPDQPADMAVDGDPNTQWSAGDFPTQWIEIDLGAPYSIGEIRLTVGQWPAGKTVHQLWVGTSRNSMQMINQFSGSTSDFDVLSYVPPAFLPNIRYIKIITTESPSWVSWREIEVLAPFPATPTPIPASTPTP